MRQQTLHKAVDILTSRKGRLVLLLGVVLVITIRLVAIQRVGVITAPGYSSDDVAQETILNEWQHGIRGGAIIGDDNWFIKFPLYVVMNNVPVSPDLRAFITTWLLTVTALVGAVVVLWLIAGMEPAGSRARRLVMLALPLAIIVNIAPLALFIISRINTRNLEIPIFLALLYGLMLYDRRPFKRPWVAAGVVIGVVGLLLADDPMFRYMGAFLVASVYLGRSILVAGPVRRWLNVVGVVAAGWVAAALIKKLLLWLLPIGFAIHPQSFTDFEGFIYHIKVFFAIDLQLMNAAFWGQPLKVAVLMKVFEAFLLGVGLLAAGRLIQRGLANRDLNPSTLVIGLLPFWIIAIVLFSGFDADIRYLILLPFAVGLSLVVAASRGLISLRLTALAVVLFAVCAIFNLASVVSLLAHHRSNQGNVEEKAAAQVLEHHHLTKGYATYWRANATSYFANYSADIANITCMNANHTVQFNPLLSERGILQKASPTSFIMYYPASAGGAEECTYATIAGQFGKPDEVLSIPTSAAGHIAVYHHNIAPQLSPEAN